MSPRLSLLLLSITACASVETAASRALPKLDRPELPTAAAAPEPIYPPQGAPVVIEHATVLTAAGAVFAPGHVVMQDGLLRAVGPGDAADIVGATFIDGTGMFVTPGLIDTHSHMGVYPLPAVTPHEDGNELTRPTTPELWAEHSFWPQDPALRRSVAMGGITTIQVLPGSGNLIGGRSFVAKLRPATSARAMRFVDAPQGLKMACGENPKSVYGGKGQAPSTRMGNVAGFRRAFQEALEYRYHWHKYDYELQEWRDKHEDDTDDSDKDAPPDPPERDLAMDTLMDVLDGKILVQNHCYRADELHIMLDLAAAYGFKIRSFHHGLEAYKLRERLHTEGVAVSTWSDWWGYKLEAFDGVPQNAAMLAAAGVKVAIHSDSESEIRHLNQEAAKAQASGRKMGIEVDDNEVLRWVTANPAWVLGVEARTGTLEVNKMADVVLWDHHPFSVYARPVKVFIDGVEVFDHAKTASQLSDFELGQVTP